MTFLQLNQVILPFTPNCTIHFNECLFGFLFSHHWFQEGKWAHWWLPR